jgi:hypothetical protein
VTNGGYGSDSSPSRGCQCRPAIRPFAPSAIGYQAFHLNPLSPAALSRRPRPQHQCYGSQSRSIILALQCFKYGALGIVERAFKLFGCLGPPERFEVRDCRDCSCMGFVGAHERQWLIRIAALARVRELGEASDDAGSQQRLREADASIEASVAPVCGNRFEAQRASMA